MTTLIPKFDQSTTGASNRPFNEKLQETFSGKDYGAVEDGVTDDSTALTNASDACASTTDTVLLGGVSSAPNMELSVVANTTFEGKIDHLLGAYRKAAIPQQSPSDSLQFDGIIPSKHLKTFNQAYKPKVCLVGDSISTYFANSLARGDMLADNLHKVLNDQCPDGIDFIDMAIGGTGYGSLFTNQYNADIEWYAGYSTSDWIDVVKAQNPDLVVLSFGMNDSSNIKVNDVKDAIDYIQTWAKVPSIVLATNLVPNPSSTTFPEGDAGQQGRDEAAGFVRTYGNYRNVGVLDVHRKDCMVRDGFDPTSSCITKGTLINAIGNTVTGYKTCIDWYANIAYNASALTAGTGYLTAKTGSGDNDFIQIIKTDATHMQVVAYAGSTDSLGVNVGDGVYPYTWPTTGVNYLSVEKIGGYVSIYSQAVQLGSYSAPIAFGKCPSLGGIYTPKTTGTPSGVLLNTTFHYGEQRVNIPSITNSLLWGNETVSNIDYHGGSGYNHPGGFAATHIYRPLLQSTLWYQRQFITGTVAIASGISSITVNFAPAQKAFSYSVLMSEVGAGLGTSYRVSAYTDTSFEISFSSATTGSGFIFWQIISGTA